jgi:hypothetical protein
MEIARPEGVMDCWPLCYAGGCSALGKARVSVISTPWTVVLAPMSLAVPGLSALTLACPAYINATVYAVAERAADLIRA